MANWVDVSPQAVFVGVPGSYNAAHLPTDLPGGIQDLSGLERVQVDTQTGKKRRLRFAQLQSGSTTAGANNALYWYDNAHSIAIVQHGSSTSDLNGFAGFALGNWTNGNYDWLLVEGNVTVTLQAAVNAQKGDRLIGSTTDTVCNVVGLNTAATYNVIGWTTGTASAAGGTVAAYINVP